jgi:hypothetical protein
MKMDTENQVDISAQENAYTHEDWYSRSYSVQPRVIGILWLYQHIICCHLHAINVIQHKAYIHHAPEKSIDILSRLPTLNAAINLKVRYLLLRFKCCVIRMNMKKVSLMWSMRICTHNAA